MFRPNFRAIFRLIFGQVECRIDNAFSSRENENLKRKLYNCNANIYFNRTCLIKQFTPHYVRIKIINSSTAPNCTQHKISKTRIKYEIKYLYIKKSRKLKALSTVHSTCSKFSLKMAL